MNSTDPDENGRDVASWFASLSLELHSEPEEQPTIERILSQVQDVVHGHWVGITLLRRRGRLETVGASHDLVERCDALQVELGEGPCMESASEGVGFLSRDTREDRRWPVWGPRVAELGVRSVLSLRLVVPQAEDPPRLLGAVNVYDSRRNAFSTEDLDRGLVFAVHAARALATARQIEGLEVAIHSRHMIGVAQGILMQRYGMSIDSSFEAMRRYSSESNTKLRDLAKIVIDSRHLPTTGHAATETRSAERAAAGTAEGAETVDTGQPTSITLPAPRRVSAAAQLP